jgi:transposase
MPIPVQLSEPEFTAIILPHLSMPKRDPKCTPGYHRVFNLILWVLYTGMQWKCLPIPPDAQGKPAIHYLAVYNVFARWADDVSLWRAFLASMAYLAAAKHLDIRVLHGDGTNTVAKKGGMAVATRATSTRRARKSSPSQTTMAMHWLPSPWPPSMSPTWSCGPGAQRLEKGGHRGWSRPGESLPEPRWRL